MRLFPQMFPQTGINRAAKADRGARLATSVPQTRTISLTLNGLSDTSVLLRIPAAGGAQRGLSAPIKSGGRATAVACEPMVSVLTEVAKAARTRPLRHLSDGLIMPGLPRRDQRLDPDFIRGPSVFCAVHCGSPLTPKREAAEAAVAESAA